MTSRLLCMFLFSFVLHVLVFVCLACSCFRLSCMFLFSFVLHVPVFICLACSCFHLSCKAFFLPAAQAGLSAQRGVFLQGTRPCVHNRITVLFQLTSRNVCRTCCPLALRLSRPGATSLPSVSLRTFVITCARAIQLRNFCHATKLFFCYIICPRARFFSHT